MSEEKILYLKIEANVKVEEVVKKIETSVLKKESSLCLLSSRESESDK